MASIFVILTITYVGTCIDTLFLETLQSVSLGKSSSRIRKLYGLFAPTRCRIISSYVLKSLTLHHFLFLLLFAFAAKSWEGTLINFIKGALFYEIIC